MLAGCLFQCRVWQAGGLFAKFRDLSGQVESLGAHQHLNLPGQTVQVASERGDERLLLARGAQAEVDGRADRDHGDAIFAEVDDTGVGDRLGGQSQRGGRDRRLIRFVGRKPLRSGPDAFGGGYPVLRAEPLSQCGQHQPVQGDAVALTQCEERGSGPDGGGEDEEHR